MGWWPWSAETSREGGLRRQQNRDGVPCEIVLQMFLQLKKKMFKVRALLRGWTPWKLIDRPVTPGPAGSAPGRKKALPGKPCAVQPLPCPPPGSPSPHLPPSWKSPSQAQERRRSAVLLGAPALHLVKGNHETGLFPFVDMFSK